MYEQCHQKLVEETRLKGKAPIKSIFFMKSFPCSFNSKDIEIKLTINFSKFDHRLAPKDEANIEILKKLYLNFFSGLNFCAFFGHFYNPIIKF